MKSLRKRSFLAWGKNYDFPVRGKTYLKPSFASKVRISPAWRAYPRTSLRAQTENSRKSSRTIGPQKSEKVSRRVCFWGPRTEDFFETFSRLFRFRSGGSSFQAVEILTQKMFGVVERPTRETQAGQHLDTVLGSISFRGLPCIREREPRMGKSYFSNCAFVDATLEPPKCL